MRALLSGGGRFDLANEQLPLLQRALTIAGFSPRLLTIPTPLKYPPFDELDGLIKLFGTASIWPDVKLEILTANTQDHPDYDQAASLIKWANIILILGGNYAEQMDRWRKTGIDQLLVDAAHNDSALMVGGSTGFACWFRAAQTNSHPHSYNGSAHSRYRLEPGLGVLPALACPHYESHHRATGEARATRFRGRPSPATHRHHWHWSKHSRSH
jgi:hypothetical protein